MRRLILAIVLFAGSASLSLAVAEAGGGGCQEPLSESKGGGVTMAMACFAPTVLYVEPGKEVTWTNRDKAGHNVVGVGASWSDGRTMLVEESTSAAFDAPGVYPYYCGFHPGMVGVIVVGEAASSAAAAASAEASASGSRSSGLPAIAVAGGFALALALTGGGLATLRLRRSR